MVMPTGNTPPFHVVPTWPVLPLFSSMMRSRSNGSPSRTAMEYGVSRPFDCIEFGRLA